MRIRSEDVVWQVLDDEVVALDLSGSAYFRANRSGTVLWRLLGEATSRGDLVAALTDAYGITAERAASDVDAFLSALDAHGLLTREEGARPARAGTD